MEEARIELSARERERLKVLHEVEQAHLRQVEAARRLRLSARQLPRLLVRLRTAGDRGLMHVLRGRPPTARITSFTAFSEDIWWTWPGSNRRPPACKAGALPAELHAHRKRYSDSKAFPAKIHPYTRVKLSQMPATPPGRAEICG